MVATATIAAFVLVAIDSEGSYFVTAWPLVGGAIALAAGALAFLGTRAPRLLLASCAAFLAFGLLAVLSVAWGGLPDVAWTWLDEMAIAGLALLAGVRVAQLAGGRARLVAPVGVLAGLTIEAAYLLVRLATGDAPSSWFDGREVAGPVQYHNAQAAAFAIGIPLALWASNRRNTVVRASGGATAALLGSAILVTQSRGAVIAVAVAGVVQIALARDLRLAAHGVIAAFAIGLLVLPLRSVDASLVDSPGGDASSFRSYAAWTVVVAVGLAAAFALPLTRRASTAVAGFAAAVVLAGVVAAVPSAHRMSHALHRALNGEKPADLPAGQTRLSSLSLSGRRQLWRLALDAYADHPVAGDGIGSYTTYFTRHRNNKDLYVLQPHSLELEALTELGPLGVAALVAAFGLLVAAIIRGAASRGLRAAAIGAVLVLLVEASIDWTFSFPSLVVAAFIVAGAAAAPGPGAARGGKRVVPVAWGLASVVALVAFAGPYFAAHDVSVATASSTSTARAWTILRHARGFDPWSAEVADAQGQVAEEAGSYLLAAQEYGRAVGLSRNAWAEEYRRARALREAKLGDDADAACRRARALNPLEPLLDKGACASVE